jgi:hypothetical protein
MACTLLRSWTRSPYKVGVNTLEADNPGRSVELSKGKTGLLITYKAD